MTDSIERSGALIVRAWLEGAGQRLRARITESRDLARGEQLVSTVTSVDAVIAAVHDWLEALVVQSDFDRESGNGRWRVEGPRISDTTDVTSRESLQSASPSYRVLTRTLSPTRDAIAPDGSDVRVLVRTDAGSMAHFTLAPGEVSVAIEHTTVEELWYFLSGRGEIWRKSATDEGLGVTVPVKDGVSVSIPARTAFQFRCLGDDPLTVLGVTIPPWPGIGDITGKGEAQPAEGLWAPTVISGSELD